MVAGVLRRLDRGAPRESTFEKRTEGSGSAIAAQLRSVPRVDGDTDDESRSATAARSRSAPGVDGETDDESGGALAARSMKRPGVGR